MKVFGILAGRKMGNSEILAKEAFMAAVEVGDEGRCPVCHSNVMIQGRPQKPFLRNTGDAQRSLHEPG
jgi:DNA-directed RNA polymerase subunit RPC12/RpoP